MCIFAEPPNIVLNLNVDTWRDAGNVRYILVTATVRVMHGF